MNSLGNCAQARRAMIDRIHRRNYGEQNLSRANVTRRFVTADVFLAGLQRKPAGRPAFSVVGDADQSARHVALVLVARCEIRGVRSAETERHSKTVRAPNRDVGSEFTWRS